MFLIVISYIASEGYPVYGSWKILGITGTEEYTHGIRGTVIFLLHTCYIPLMSQRIINFLILAKILLHSIPLHHPLVPSSKHGIIGCEVLAGHNNLIKERVPAQPREISVCDFVFDQILCALLCEVRVNDAADAYFN